MDTEIEGSLFDLSAFASERNCACTELGWCRNGGHVGEPIMKATD